MAASTHRHSGLDAHCLDTTRRTGGRNHQSVRRSNRLGNHLVLPHLPRRDDWIHGRPLRARYGRDQRLALLQHVRRRARQPRRVLRPERATVAAAANAARITNWGLPCKPTVTRHQRTRVHRSRKIAQHAHDRHAYWATFAFSV